MTDTTRTVARPAASPILRPVIQTSAFLRKELVESLRQPRLLVVLVVAPFLVLSLFAAGYDQEQLVLRTRFVVPAGGLEPATIEEFTARLDRYVRSAGTTTDRVDAERALREGEVDLVVVLPDRPEDTVLAGTPATIDVLHDKLDPIQQTAVEVASQVAISELNATIVEQLVATTQEGLRPLDADLATTDDAARDALVRFEELDPRLVARPFERRTENIAPQPITMADFFAPAAVAMLVQHLALTLAAMSLVADRSLGLFETFRVAPLGSGRVLVGKYLAHGVLGVAVGGALVAAVVAGLGVPLVGSVSSVAVVLTGVVAASIGSGLILALAARSEVQAVQYALLVLLAGLFFGGFLLEVDAFRQPVRALSWLLPVTYGIRLLRGTMLQGTAPAWTDLAGLAALTAAYGVGAWALLSRRLRVG